MRNINELVATGNTDKAVDMVYDALLCIINQGSPRMNITRDTWDVLAPKLVEKMQNPEVTEAEPTEAPGDDVTILENAKTGILKIKYEGPFEMKVPKSVEKKIFVGSTYSVKSPVVEGFETETEVVTGKMTEEGVEVTVTYTAVVIPSDEDEVDEGAQHHPEVTSDPQSTPQEGAPETK